MIGQLSQYSRPLSPFPLFSACVQITVFQYLCKSGPCLSFFLSLFSLSHFDSKKQQKKKKLRLPICCVYMKTQKQRWGRGVLIFHLHCATHSSYNAFFSWDRHHRFCGFAGPAASRKLRKSKMWMSPSGERRSVGCDGVSSFKRRSCQNVVNRGWVCKIFSFLSNITGHYTTHHTSQ